MQGRADVGCVKRESRKDLKGSLRRLEEGRVDLHRRLKGHVSDVVFDVVGHSLIVLMEQKRILWVLTI